LLNLPLGRFDCDIRLVSLLFENSVVQLNDDITFLHELTFRQRPALSVFQDAHDRGADIGRNPGGPMRQWLGRTEQLDSLANRFFFSFFSGDRGGGCFLRRRRGLIVTSQGNDKKKKEKMV